MKPEDKAVVQQVRKYLVPGAIVPVDVPTMQLLLRALRQLLEQPVQEPCGWQFYEGGKWHNGMDINDHRANTEAAGVPVRDVYPEPQPAVPEELKLVREWAEKWAAISYEDSWKYAAREVLTMLATPPAQPASQRSENTAWVGLTDEEICGLITFEGASLADFVRYVESMLRDKNAAPQPADWIGLMRGVRVDGDSVVISTKGNETARKLCEVLLKQKDAP